MTSPRIDLMRRRIAKKRQALEEALSIARDDVLLQLLWALNVLQSEFRPSSFARYFQRLPPEAVRAKIGQPHFGLKWEIENLILLLLSTPKQRHTSLRDFDYYSFDTAAHFLNLIKRVDETEEVYLLHTYGIDNAMQKLAHKQFFWQRPLLQIERLYRYYYVYGQGECAAYFQDRYGISIEEFAITCIALSMQFSMDAWQAPRLPPELVPPTVVNRAISMISKDIEDMRRLTRDRITTMVVNNSAKLAFLPSTLRQHPVISSKALNGRMIAPLPQLLVFRATAGLYYDLSSGPQKLLEEANRRFEEYGRKLIEARCPRFEIVPEQQFGTKANPYKTPDLLLKDEGRIKVAFECKATKLTFAAQYSDNPYAEANGAFAQIAKGMAQLWRFFSRARRKLYEKEVVDSNAYGVVLTMDTWFHLARTQLPHLFQAAEALVADEPDVQPQDKRSIIFCSIDELDEVLAVSDEDELLETLRKSQLPEFAGWSLNNVRQPAGAEPLERRAYPFKIAEVLPLWEAIKNGP